ncbi:DUF262 domain-containing protein [Humibacillus xanthopallidus]|nr:DUF262 domain-containing protein [Humibacillus xanthopallidus]
MSADPNIKGVGLVEEVFHGEQTGVEIEQNDSTASQIADPWDPEKIRVSTKNFSLRNILDMIDSEDLDLAPDFQRNRVWKARQKSRLVESLLLQIPLPAFYFAEDDDGLLRVVDGLQRLSTIHGFVRGKEFRLADLEYLNQEQGKRFGDLSPSLQRRLHNAQIVAHVIDPTTPSEVKYDIFKRINTGGEPLNSMEIRHCMSRSRSRTFLKRCTSSEIFHKATGGVLRDHVRMHDRESALRFLAFRMLDDIEQYDSVGSLERLLDEAVTKIDDPTRVSDSELDRLFRDFERSMQKGYTLFGKHAFRKWPTTSNYRSPINRALLESWCVALVDVDEVFLTQHRDRIVTGARKAMTNDYLYINAISSSTGDPARVNRRFAVARKLLEPAQ